MRFSSKRKRAVSSLSRERRTWSSLSFSASLDSRAAASWMKSSCEGGGGKHSKHARTTNKYQNERSVSTRKLQQIPNSPLIYLSRGGLGRRSDFHWLFSLFSSQSNSRDSRVRHASNNEGRRYNFCDCTRVYTRHRSRVNCS